MKYVICQFLAKTNRMIPFLIENVALLMQNTKRVFCHILLDCAVPRFISKQSVMRE